MDCWNKILSYYMGNEGCFSINVSLMADVYFYCGDVVAPDGVKYHFEAPFWKEVYRREHEDCRFEMLLPEDKIQQYFTTNYGDEQLFAIIFAHWYGLSDKQIAYISDKRRTRTAKQYLHYFICNRQTSCVEMSAEALCNYMYEGNYCLTSEDSVVRHAIYAKGYLVDTKEGFRYIDADEYIE